MFTYKDQEVLKWHKMNLKWYLKNINGSYLGSDG